MHVDRRKSGIDVIEHLVLGVRPDHRQTTGKKTTRSAAARRKA
jgi:hypothetical protein